MAWTDLAAAFAYGSKLTSAQMQNLRDNITALANGDVGAPDVLWTAMDGSYVPGNVQQVDAGTAASYYQVLGSDNTWRRCCPNFDDSGE